MYLKTSLTPFNMKKKKMNVLDKIFLGQISQKLIETLSSDSVLDVTDYFENSYKILFSFIFLRKYLFKK